MSRRAATVLTGFLIVNATAALAERPPDPQRAAVEAAAAEFVKAFDAGDAKAVAALFTEDARIETEGAPTIAGRAAIEARFAERFAAAPGQTITLKTTSLRFPTADTALEEGIAAIATPVGAEGGPAEVDHYQYGAVYVRRDGRWLQDAIHDYLVPDPDRSPRERLAELEWMIGEWIDEDDDAVVHTSCEWAEGGAFILRKYRVESDREDVAGGVQRIGWDARLKQIRSWSFDSEGGFSEGFWSRGEDSDRWIVKTTGVLSDGRTATATNVVTREGRDVAVWTSSDRTIGGRALDDSETTTLVRRPPQPAAEVRPDKPSGAQEQ